MIKFRLPIIIITPVIILLMILNFVALDKSTYISGYKKYEVYKEIGISIEDLDKVADNFINYFLNKDDNMQLQLEVNSVERDIFNEKELTHMIDVLKLFRLSRTILIMLIIIVLALGIGLFMSKGALSIINTFIITGFTSLAIMPITYLIFPKDFYSNFVIFHKLLFTNDLWILNPKTDILLQLHPLGFFNDIGIRLLTYYVISNIVLVFLGMERMLKTKYWKRKTTM